MPAAYPAKTGAATARGAADWLCLAATPAFAVMALMTWDSDAGMICSVDPEAFSILAGMAPMYALMSIFHAAPWLRLLSNR